MTIKHPAIVADVQKPILGFDFLEDNELSMIVTKKQLILQNKHGLKTWCYRKRTETDLLSIQTSEIAAAGNIYQKYSQLQTQ